ncbi:RNA polymerase sigma factor [Flavobacterium aquatile]|uniref:RNA polymerase subunit sigma24 n=1 Tax=Flavobacterium aquatile LMG 4008 = ATCC 11947 TaxID=1453498 RepID=A0A095SRG1_9FLAO|nr:RNA polymerase sigma factor [Flavobacterium aquatile]KGD66949.1 RNA polymerase subunit sigma24 [Flavobacterium aquatile LMG 4008 = ATCC 11947]OXA68107.1 RNA polymerase subunit sigma-24 [Flavobacterium aquatile LMG 4008 = ATCC 11947]
METKMEKEPLPVLTDEVIIERILKGETELFEILLRRYNQILYRTVRSYLNDGSEIEDVMQDTYINAFQKLYQFSNKSLFSTWLIRIGINEALQKNRKLSKARLQTTSLEEKTYQLPDNTTMSQENKIAQTEKAGFIEKAFEKLPEKYRIAFMLNEVEGMSVSEISKCLEISQSNVKVRLHRGRIMMKESLLSMVTKSELFEFGNSRCDRIVEYIMKTINKL